MKKRNLLVGILTGAVVCGTLAAGPRFADRQYPEITAPVQAAALTAQNTTVNAPATVTAPQINAKAAFLLENNSGTVLFEQNADARLPIASMTKIATLGVIYDALAAGELHLDDRVLISEQAASMGGSQAFLDAGSEYAVRDLIQSIVVASANDSCVALAERIAGNVANFVERMNHWARDLGCTNTNFVNCTGLPTPGAYSCARDLAKMYQKIMQSPHYGDFNQVWMYDLTHPSGRVTGLTNTNKMIRTYPGCLGGKTGFTNEAGHCLTVAAAAGDLQPIAVVIGAPDSKTRFQAARELLDFAVNNYENTPILSKNTPIKEVKIKNGLRETVAVYPAQDYFQLTPKGQPSNLTIASEIPDSITAPLPATAAVGEIYILQDGKVLATIPAQTAVNVDAANYWQTIKKVVHRASL